MYASDAEVKGDGHKLSVNGKLLASDFSIESFKEIYRNRNNKSDNTVVFIVNNSFRSKPITSDQQIFLSEKQYFQYKDEIIDFIKSEAGFKNLTNRKTKIIASARINEDSDSQKLPNNIKNSFSEEDFKKNIELKFDIVYDTENINKDSSSYSKEDLEKAFEEGDFYSDKDIVNNESFTLRIGFDSIDKYKDRNNLPINYYLSRNDKPIFKADSKLKFKEKSNIIGSEYYISNTTTDREDFTQRFTKYLLEASKADEDFNKLTKKEQDKLIQSQIQETVPYIDEAHKNDSANIKKYQAFLNSEKWGNQRLTQYVGNVDTKTEEFDYKTIKKDNPTSEKGQTKVVTKGVKGKKITKITYKVDRTSGELIDPVSEVVEETKPIDEVILVGTKKVVPAKPIEDIAKTTKTTKEVIEARISYESDDTLEFEKQNVAIKPINGEKEITTVSQSGKKDVVTEKVIKDKVNGVTKVGNKKVEVATKDGVTTTTTTIYEVEKETGKLVNPKVTTHKTTKIGTIEDIAKKIEPKVEEKETKPEEKPKTEKLPDKEIKVVGGNITTDHLNLDRYLYSESPYKHGRKQIEKVRFNIDGNRYVERKALPIRTDIKTNKSEYPYYIFTIGDMTYIKVTEKGREPRKMDVKPYLKNERTMLPLRYVGEALNADVTWDNNSRTAYFTRDGITARIQIDGNKIELSNGKVFTMDAKPDNINSRIFVPITNVSQVFTLTNGNTIDGIKQNIEWSQQDYTTTVYPSR